MHKSVRDAYHAFSMPLEGRVRSMYCDVKGLITTGVGNLIDPMAAALQLPWKHEGTGVLATAHEVASAWSALKEQKDKYAKLHWKYAASLNDLRLSDEDIDALVSRKLDENEAYLRRTFKEWDSFPADAQLGILSMAWACGPGFTKTFAHFTAAALAQNWEGCVASCKIREEGNPGVVPRNAKNRFCFHNAQLVKDYVLAVDHLCWPDLPKLASSSVHQASVVRDEADAALDAFVLAEAARIERISSSQAIREYEEAGLVDEPTGGGSNNSA